MGTGPSTTLTNVSTENYLSYFTETGVPKKISGVDVSDTYAYQSTLLGRCDKHVDSCKISLDDASSGLRLGQYNADDPAVVIQTSSAPISTSGEIPIVSLTKGPYDPADPKTYLYAVPIGGSGPVKVDVITSGTTNSLNMQANQVNLKGYGKGTNAQAFEIEASLNNPSGTPIQYCKFQLPYIDPLTGLDYSFNSSGVSAFLDPKDVKFIQYKRTGKFFCGLVEECAGSSCSGTYNRFEYTVEACNTENCTAPTVLFKASKDFSTLANGCVAGNSPYVGEFQFETSNLPFVVDEGIKKLNGCLIQIQQQLPPPVI